MSHSKIATAWAVIDHDGLKIRSVSDTRRAAIVNWLVTDAHQLVFNNHSDDQINAMWDAARGEAKVSPVAISYVQHGRTDTSGEPGK